MIDDFTTVKSFYFLFQTNNCGVLWAWFLVPVSIRISSKSSKIVWQISYSNVWLNNWTLYKKRDNIVYLTSPIKRNRIFFVVIHIYLKICAHQQFTLTTQRELPNVYQCHQTNFWRCRKKMTNLHWKYKSIQVKKYINMPISDKIFYSLDFLIMLRRFLVVEPTNM